MKQIWPNYSYSPTTNVLTLTGLNIDRDQLLLVSAPERGRIMYNFADSTVTASAFTAGANTGLTLVASTAGLTTTAALVIYYDDQVSGISGTVTANVQPQQSDDSDASIKFIPIGYASVDGDGQLVEWTAVDQLSPLPVYFPANYPIPAGTNNIGVVTANFGGNSRMMGTVAPLGSATTGYVSIGGDGSPIGSGAGRVVVDVVNQAGNSFLDNCLVNNNAIRAFGTVTIGAGTAQIGSVTASISGTVPISISSVTIGNFPATQPISIASVTVGNSVTIGSLPAISGTVTANIAISSTAITSGVFSSLTSATLVPGNTARKMATVYNLGAGQLFVNAGASATTLGGGFMVALSSGDFYECSYTTTTLSAIFATAGTASWVSH